MTPARATYGIDAPPVVRGLVIGGAICALATIVGHALPTLAGLRGFLYPGLSLLGTALWMIFGSKVWKLRIRDRVLDGLALVGSERVLDVGCGRGLMLVGLAKRLPTGRAVGLDLWRTVDQSGNDPAVTRANAEAEGVAARVDIETGDMTKMPFADGSFDAVVSSWAIHNLPTAGLRAQALGEIARVLRPGGKVVLLDIGPARGYAPTLRKVGLTNAAVALDDLAFFIPTWRITATKPLAR